MSKVGIGNEEIYMQMTARASILLGPSLPCHLVAATNISSIFKIQNTKYQLQNTKHKIQNTCHLVAATNISSNCR